MKRAKFNYGNLANPPTHDLAELLAHVRSQTTGWTDRHWPARPPGSPAPDAGTRCMYIGDIKRRKTLADGSGGGMFFTVGSYVYGKGEHQIAVDMLGDAPDVQSGPLFDKTGNQRSILHEFRCVALGETLIVQNEQGGGGLPALADFLTALFRAHHVKLKLPRMVLIDVFSNDLKKILIQGGGVKTMRVKMIDPGKPKQAKTLGISSLLYDARKAVKNTGKLTVEWEAEDGDGLSLDTVINVFETSQEIGADLASVDLDTMHGGPVRNVGKYKAKREIPVTIDAHGIEHKDEIKPSLFEYLDDLRVPDEDDWRLIDDEGMFLSGRVLELKD
ncbi:hypothetical protein [Stenotrophomonas bentonitica]